MMDAVWMTCATRYLTEFGLSVIPVFYSKKPAIPWKEYQERHATVEELKGWPHENLGIVTGAISNVVIVDCESEVDAKWFWYNRGKTRTVAKTKRGYHLYFRHPGHRVMNGVKVEGRYDVRGDGGFALLPPSMHSDGNYLWTIGHDLIQPSNLPVFKAVWRPTTNWDTVDEKKVTDGIAYISKIRAISGQGGHKDTYRAAAKLREAGLSEIDALLALQNWNRTNADPPWSDKELVHKIKSVYRVQQ